MSQVVCCRVGQHTFFHHCSWAGLWQLAQLPADSTSLNRDNKNSEWHSEVHVHTIYTPGLLLVDVITRTSLDYLHFVCLSPLFIIFFSSSLYPSPSSSSSSLPSSSPSNPPPSSIRPAPFYYACVSCSPPRSRWCCSRCHIWRWIEVRGLRWWQVTVPHDNARTTNRTQTAASAWSHFAEGLSVAPTKCDIQPCYSFITLTGSFSGSDMRRYTPGGTRWWWWCQWRWRWDDDEDE